MNKKTSIILITGVILSGIIAGVSTYFLMDAKINDKDEEIVALKQDINDREEKITKFENTQNQDCDPEVNSPSTTPETNTTCETDVYPQIFIKGKSYFSSAELSELQTKLIDPYVKDHKEKGESVVSMYIHTEGSAEDNRAKLLIDVIISNNDGNQDAIFNGFVYEKVGGHYPLWESDEII